MEDLSLRKMTSTNKKRNLREIPPVKVGNKTVRQKKERRKSKGTCRHNIEPIQQQHGGKQIY